MVRIRHSSGSVSRGSHTGGGLTDFRSPGGTVIDNPVWGTNVAPVTSDDGTLGLVTALTVTPGSIDGGALAPGAAVENIAYGSITGVMIGTDQITAANIAANSIGADEIAANSITADEIAAGTITGNEIAAGAITADDITTGTLTGIEITGVNITAGGNGFDGLNVRNDDGNWVGYWNGSQLYSFVSIFSEREVIGHPNYGVVAAVSYGTSGLYSTYEGALGVDYASGTDGRLYARHGYQWHYVPFAGGFVVPVHETICPVCEKALMPGDDMIGRGDRQDADGALHALYIHLKCAGKPMVKARADGYWAAGRNPAVTDAYTQEAVALTGATQDERMKPPKDLPVYLDEKPKEL
jgi:hypothetical protein